MEESLALYKFQFAGFFWLLFYYGLYLNKANFFLFLGGFKIHSFFCVQLSLDSSYFLGRFRLEMFLQMF